MMRLQHMEGSHTQQQQTQQVPWMTAPDIAKRLKNPFLLPGGPAAVAGSAVSCRQRLSAFQDEARSTLAELQACVEQGVDQHVGPQLTEWQLAAAVDASELRLPHMVTAVQGSAQLPAHSSRLAEASAGPATTAVAAAVQASLQGASLNSNGIAQPGAFLELLPHMPAIPTTCNLLESCREAARGMPELPRSGSAVSRPSSASIAPAGGNSSSDDSSQLLVPGQEVVVTLQLLESGQGSESKRQIMQELQVLGSNTLAQLRDAIRCPLDKLAQGLGAGNHAGYFYLDNTFYDDTRVAAASECSGLVQKWATAVGLAAPRGLHYDATVAEQRRQQQQRQQVGGAAHPAMLEIPQQQHQQLPNHNEQQQQLPAGAAQQQQQQCTPHEMQHTLVADLLLQVSNRPMGLYSHQGCCEHQVIVADVRLLHSTDTLLCSSYPRTTRMMSLAKRYPCGLCRRHGGLCLLLHHPEAPEDVVMLCTRCEQLFDISRYPQSRKVVLADG